MKSLIVCFQNKQLNLCIYYTMDYHTDYQNRKKVFKKVSSTAYGKKRVFFLHCVLSNLLFQPAALLGLGTEVVFEQKSEEKMKIFFCLF